MGTSSSCSGHHYGEHIHDGEVGKTEKQSSMRAVERGRTGDAKVVTIVRDG